MVMAGLLFKMAATPFHFWAPDVYQATPMPVLALFSTVPKVAAAATLYKIITAFSLIGQSHFDWQSILIVLTIATLTIGNFSALWQNNVKRLMAYSSIGQAGFLLVAICNFSEIGWKAFLFYSVILMMATILVFLLLNYFEKENQTRTIDDFNGLGRKRPLLGVCLTIAFISLVGLPPLAGFNAKLFVFTGLLESYSTTHKPLLLWLFAFGLLNTVVSLYYYLKVPYRMFLKESAFSGTTINSNSSTANEWLVFQAALLAIGLLLFFFQPGWLMLN